MPRKIVKSEVFEINTSLLNKAQKTIYNKVSNNYRFWETYDFLKFIYKNEVDFSDIFMEDLFNILIITNKYTSEIISAYEDCYIPEKYDMTLIDSIIPLDSAACEILEAVILKKSVLNTFELEKLMFASLIIFICKSSYYSRFRYPSKLNKYIENKSINEYVNAINSKNDRFEFISDLIETKLKNEAEIFKNNPKLYKFLNGKS